MTQKKMINEELEKEAEDKGVKYADSLEYTISKFSDEEGYCWSQVEQAYEKGALDFAESREKRIKELEAQIEKMKQDLDSARENANRQEQWEIYSVLNDIYNDNFEVITSVSNQGDKRKMNDLKGIIEDCNKSDLVSKKVIKKVIEIIGQEEWNDLYDEQSDICTTMGELIITLKGITDLEKENAELLCQKNRNKSCYSCANATERCFRNEIGCPCQKYKSYKEENAELEKKISVLLSCKNCPDNKGGLLCQKEYEDKCLAQKIQYIKELQEEIAELKAQIEKMKRCFNCKYQNKFVESKCDECEDYSKWEIKEKK